MPRRYKLILDLVLLVLGMINLGFAIWIPGSRFNLIVGIGTLVLLLYRPPK